MKIRIIALTAIAALIAVSCGIALLPDTMSARDNPADPWLDPYSVPVATLTVSGTDEFGTSVDADGDYLAVGVPRNTVGVHSLAGNVYVYRRIDASTWGEVQELAAGTPLASADFGASVSVSGNWMAVGATGEDSGSGVFGGAVYLYRRTGSNTWTFTKQLTLTDAGETPALNDQFGNAVHLDGLTLFAGAPQRDVVHPINGGPPENSAGAVYIWKYVVDSWDFQERLDAGVTVTEAADVLAGRRFGYRIALSGEDLAIGGLGDHEGIDDAGAVYLYEYNGASFDFDDIIHAPEPEITGWFSSSIAIDDDDLIVGSHGHTADAKSTAGAAWVFEKTASGWNPAPVRKLTAPTPADQGYVGLASALIGDTYLLGAPGHDDTGVVYAFQKAGGEWGYDSVIAPSDTVLFFGFSIAESGEYAYIGAPANEGAVYIFTSN